MRKTGFSIKYQICNFLKLHRGPSLTKNLVSNVFPGFVQLLDVSVNMEIQRDEKKTVFYLGHHASFFNEFFFNEP